MIIKILVIVFLTISNFKSSKSESDINDNKQQIKLQENKFLNSCPKRSLIKNVNIEENDKNEKIMGNINKSLMFLNNSFEQCSLEYNYHEIDYNSNDKNNRPLRMKNTPNDQKNIFSNIFIIKNEFEFYHFLEEGALQLIIFYSTEFYLQLSEFGQKKFVSFLFNFNKASKDLSKYDIHLGLVNCSMNIQLDSCSEDKIGVYAFGFQNKEEKIGFPLETLFSVDSVVSSALHLSLLNNVPIIQSIFEREELKDRCRNKCDIILAYHRSLGTKEHRLFLESAVKYREENLLFSLTTYSSGIYGLPDHPSKDMDETPDPSIYILHCSKQKLLEDTEERKTEYSNVSEKSASSTSSLADDDSCKLVSHYNGKFIEKEFYEFLEAFKLPLWHELSRDFKSKEDVIEKPLKNEKKFKSKGMKSLFETPYNNLSIPWSIFVLDETSRERVYDLMLPITKLLRGTVAILTMNKQEMTQDVEKVLGIQLNDLKLPAILYLHFPHEERRTQFVNDFDNAYKWILRQFLASKKKEKKEEEEETKEENNQEMFEDFYDIEELQQDDEVVLEMVSESELKNVISVNGEKHFNNLLNKDRERGKIITIAFYYSWDPVSNILLQHLEEISNSKNIIKNIELYKVNCYDWPRICNEEFKETSVPYLKIFFKGQNITYNGPIRSDDILKFLLTRECNSTRQISSEVDLEIFLDQGMNCSASKLFDAYIAGLFETEKDAEGFTKAMNNLLGLKMMVKLIGKNYVQKKCQSKKGCIIISKPLDTFQPYVSLEVSNHGLLTMTQSFSSFNVECTENLITCIRRYSQHALSPLTPELFELFNEESIRGKRVLFIYFASSIEEVLRGNLRSEKTQKFYDFGRIAANESRIGIIFSYIERGSSLENELRKAYHLEEDVSYIVGVDFEKGIVTTFEVEAESSSVNINTWITNVIQGNVQSRVSLNDDEFGPAHKSFQFLDYIERDVIAKAEEKLNVELESVFGTEKKYVTEKDL